LSTAVAEPEPKTEQRRITHQSDMPVLKSYLATFGGKLDEPQLVDEYFEYREMFGQGFGKRPGPMPEATLIELAMRQKRRLAKQKPKEGK
jgi:hypothetical protein